MYDNAGSFLSDKDMDFPRNICFSYCSSLLPNNISRVFSNLFPVICPDGNFRSFSLDLSIVSFRKKNLSKYYTYGIALTEWDSLPPDESRRIRVYLCWGHLHWDSYMLTQSQCSMEIHCFGSALVSMRIRIQHFRWMRIRIQIQGFDDLKLEKD